MEEKTGAGKELGIALVVVLIMVIICVVVISIQKGGATTSTIGVFKYFETEKGEKGYAQCNVSQGNLAVISSEFNRIMKTEGTAVSPRQINGTYKVVAGPKDEDSYIAFDDNSNVVYVSKTKTLYSVKSDLYNLVINSCKTDNEIETSE